MNIPWHSLLAVVAESKEFNAKFCAEYPDLKRFCIEPLVRNIKVLQMGLYDWKQANEALKERDPKYFAEVEASFLQDIKEHKKMRDSLLASE